MLMFKPEISDSVVHEFLSTHFKDPITDLGHIEGGHISQVVTFASGGKEFVLRINSSNMDANFEKEDFISTAYASEQVPIPPVVARAHHNDLHYIITPKYPGRQFDSLSRHESAEALPSILGTLAAIHTTDISHQTGFGLFNGRGQGFFPDWPGNLRCVKDEERADGFFGKWHTLFDTSFLDRNEFNRIYEIMESLITHCPTKRYLVHGGFAGGNVLIHKGSVSAVIDWMDAKYGDFIYDIAWITYWDLENRYRDTLLTEYTRRDFDMKASAERILCYHCYMALDGMRFFSKKQDFEGYTWVVNRISQLLAARDLRTTTTR
jgi:hygromycin-B 4-O-kinase